jgi:2-hydroxychromene-2-carboxylate isomerase
MATIEFFHDFSSPYSYLAATRIKELAERTKADFQPKPFVLGAIFKARNTSLPALIPVRAAYMYKDITAWARDYGIPITLPENFPINAIKAMRAVLAVSDPGKSWNLTRLIYDAYWGQGRDISQADVLAEVLARAELDPAEILAATERQEIKDQLRANTDSAFDRGAFGAPTIFVDDQMFLGNDRLPFVERAARGERLHD